MFCKHKYRQKTGQEKLFKILKINLWTQSACTTCSRTRPRTACEHGWVLDLIAKWLANYFKFKKPFNEIS